MAQMPQDDLEPLITECPSCRTRFRVSETQLERARGRVRCGACLTVFHGTEHLVLEGAGEAVDEEQARQVLDALLDELAGQSPDSAAPGAGDAAGADSEGSAEPAPATPFEVVGGPAGMDSGPDENAAGDRAATAERGAAPPAAATPTAAPAAAPKPMPPAGPKPMVPPAHQAAPEQAAAAPVIFGEPRVRRPLVWLGIVAGLVLLAAQVLWYQFDDWAAEPPWRAVYAPVCTVLGCELPVQQDLTRLSTRNLAVRTHPTERGALLVNAVIVNGAGFPQPFPVLELQFTTVRGSLVAARRFAPDEYLAGDAEDMELIPPRTPVQIELTLDDPGPDAVNYRLLFR